MRRKILPAIAIVAVIIAVAILFRYYQGEPQENIAAVCGDGICDENCLSCPRDCKCQDGEYCSEYGSCITPVCGNNICDFGESHRSCCIDCPCLDGGICNTTIKICEQPFSQALEDSGDVYIEDYFSSRNTTFEILGSEYTRCMSGICRLYTVSIDGTGMHDFLVNETGDVSYIQRD